MITRRQINREIFDDDIKLSKPQQFRKNMLILEEQETIFGVSVSYTLSEVIYEDIVKQFGKKIKVLTSIKGCNDYNYDSMHGLYKHIERSHRYHIYAIVMLGTKIIIRGKIDNKVSGYYRRQSGVVLKPGPKPKDV